MSSVKQVALGVGLIITGLVMAVASASQINGEQVAKTEMAELPTVSCLAMYEMTDAEFNQLAYDKGRQFIAIDSQGYTNHLDMTQDSDITAMRITMEDTCATLPSDRNI